jgi:hypothetical protein
MKKNAIGIDATVRASALKLFLGKRELGMNIAR